MATPDSKLSPDDFDEEDIESYLALARIQGETTDTDEWIAALEDMARVAWRLMTEDQKETFRAEPEILALTDNFGDFADDQNADF
ncbi:hypothetical protein ACELLULO517_10720 [Acidisoma cellulosilytica]|uniref:Uncharacterized protein n=1 Tax=Acidisoma cellulosilyticum TaxID=2802395 RepID=A0A963Z0Z7_9PROT|nr:hypothetical protein [Acidisoma cellulosilyticum]MCB8880705.1 hypothetical protein [Acidisoma cellulosilyticum]